MFAIYQDDLAYVHAAAFEGLARGAATEILRRLRNASVPVRHIIDVGCGAGPLTKALLDGGFEVTGVDISSGLLQLARTHAPAGRFLQASAYDIEIRDCQAVLAVGEPLAYHGVDADADLLVGRFFQRVAQALPPGGLLIFDLIGLGNPPLTARAWSSGADWAVLVETTEEQSLRRLVRNIECFRRVGRFYRRTRECHQVRVFDVGSIRSQLASCGFAVEISESYGDQSLAPRRHAFFATRLADTPRQ